MKPIDNGICPSAKSRKETLPSQESNFSPSQVIDLRLLCQRGVATLAERLCQRSHMVSEVGNDQVYY